MVSYLSAFWVFIYLLTLVLIFLFIWKRLWVLKKRQIKYTEVEALDHSYKTLLKILFVLFIILAIWSSFIIITYI